MEKILIQWLVSYTNVKDITLDTKFSELNFDLFDQAQTVKFIKDKFNLDANKQEIWPKTVKDLINDISCST